MKQIRIIQNPVCSNLERGVNEALKSIDDDHPEIKYMLEEDTIVIEYEEKITQLMCVDCQHFDHTVGVAKAFGLCQCRGERVRFTCHACEEFKDIRG